ncbi:MAG: PAS domain S-box protein [Methylacidiphilales bacterium]|nr:PAS domain S-box protein [Candidatus Methylacidiphilales bacterium]
MKPFNITRRLSAAFCILAVLLLLVGWQGVRHLHQLNVQIQNVVYDRWETEQLSHEALSRSDDNGRIILQVFLIENQNEINQLLAQRAANTDFISALVQSIEPRLKSEEEKRLFGTIRTTRTSYIDSYKQALSLLLTENKRDEARQMMADIVRPKLTAYHNAWNAFDQHEVSEIEEVLRQSKAEYASDQRSFVSIVILAGLMTGGIGIFTVWRMGREVAVRLQAEEALRLEQAQLELRVLDRTAELVRANDELQKARKTAEIADVAKFSSMVNMAAAQRLAHVGSWEMDLLNLTELETNPVHWSDEVFRIVGYEPGEVEPSMKLISRLVPENEHVAMRNALAGAITQRQPYDLVHRIIRKNGEERTVQELAEVFFDETTDRPLRIVGTTQDITERKRAEVALQESEVKFRTLFDVANDSIFILHNGIFVDCNTRGLELFGVTREQILGQSPTLFSPLIQPDGRNSEEKAREIIQRAVEGEPQFFEWVHCPHDGAPVYTDISLQRFELGGEPYIQAIARNITERKEAEKQLLWKTAFFEAQVHSALDGILVVDNEGKKVLQNQRMVDLWNIPRQLADEPDDRSELQWVTEQIKHPPQFAKKVAYLYAHPDEVSHDELELINGKFFDRYSAPVRGKDGKYYGRIWAFRDITQYKRAEAQIVEQAAFLDEARDAIFVRDLKGKILFWNKGAERLYGWASREIVGQYHDDILYADLKALEESYRVAVSEGEWNGELKHFTKDKRELTIESRWTLIRDQDGRPKSVLAINTDITERKKIEAQFMRAQRMENIGTLAGGVAHDLNNILAPIMMSIDLLKGMSDKPQATKILETIEVSAKRGADIVRQVLSFARGVEGERIEVQPKHLLKDLENIIQGTFPKNLRLQFSIPDDTWTLPGDPTQMHQILLNLCVNARDAMPNGGSLTISVENCALDEQYAAMQTEAKPGRYVKFSVTDSGTGMPPDIIKKIFDPFFTTKDIHKGTGLGLSTVMGIVKSHEGIINVSSEPGKGTTFDVYLPAMETSSAAQEKQKELAGLPRGNGETILVVDDEASIRTITSQTLQAFGYRILTAADGANAVVIYAQHRNEIAAVLTDMMMPIMDGPATIHALMRINPEIKIVAVSGLNANADVAKASKAGVKHFLTKPYTAGTLLKTLRATLDEA